MTSPPPPQAPETSSRQPSPHRAESPAKGPSVTNQTSVRRTVLPRPMITAEFTNDGSDGFSPTDRYVRRYWIPLLGPGAVADLLRLTAAAQRGRPLKLPIHLATLVREGLAHRTRSGTVGVNHTVPELAPHQIYRLPPALRRQHQRALSTRTLATV